MCTADCVSRCGSLAELPRTEASQLVGCFEETCGCTNKWSDVSGNQERTEDQHIAYDADLMHQYFDLIHNQERVEYLLLQQNVVEYILNQENSQLLFLAESDEKVIKKRLNDVDGVK